ncbi:hypothetical protein [Mesomycoplasma ovipneumoniae]|uniref:hypothetical protein n=1 Tax=Mesomycoplasma ovipneumoniae TaxID=29562 RepID=UPI001E342DF2|nr:hypothetical protein [Mesomycoplasma ovipneumoniae]
MNNIENYLCIIKSKDSRYFATSLSVSRVWQFDGKNSLFSEYKYAKIPVNPCFLT